MTSREKSNLRKIQDSNTDIIITLLFLGWLESNLACRMSEALFYKYYAVFWIVPCPKYGENIVYVV